MESESEPAIFTLDVNRLGLEDVHELSLAVQVLGAIGGRIELRVELVNLFVDQRKLLGGSASFREDDMLIRVVVGIRKISILNPRREDAALTLDGLGRVDGLLDGLVLMSHFLTDPRRTIGGNARHDLNGKSRSGSAIPAIVAGGLHGAGRLLLLVVGVGRVRMQSIPAGDPTSRLLLGCVPVQSSIFAMDVEAILAVARLEMLNSFHGGMWMQISDDSGE